MELLRENFTDILVESILEESTNEKRWFIEGVTLQSNKKNQNGRIYVKEVLQKAIEEHRINFLDKDRSAAELNHPKIDAHEVCPENICAKFISVKESGNDFITKARVCKDLPKGKIVSNLLDEGFRLGISSRGLGSLKTQGNDKIVTEYSIVTYGDVVWNPSCTDAMLNGIMENKEYLWENGVLVQKDLSQELDTYKKIISEAKTKDVQKVVKQIFKDYMTKLNSK